MLRIKSSLLLLPRVLGNKEKIEFNPRGMHRQLGGKKAKDGINLLLTNDVCLNRSENQVKGLTSLLGVD